MKTPDPSIRALALAPLLAGVVSLLAFTGCNVSGPGYASGSVAVVGSDDYVYYPDSEVYYSNTHHHYVYRDGSRWVTQAQPPRSWNRSSASVHVDFHDAPEHHHAEVVRSYPKNWHPAAQPHPKAPEHKDDRHDDKDHHDDHR